MSLKSTSDYLFQLAYSPSPQTQLLDSINILHIDPEPHAALVRSQQDLLQLCMPSTTKRDSQTQAFIRTQMCTPTHRAGTI